MKVIIQKEASTFYFTMALLKVVKRNIQFLLDSQAVAQNLKRDLKIMSSMIGGLERTCNASLSAGESAQWQREWTDKDYEVFAGVFGVMCDMTEEQRAAMEEFANQMAAGDINVELKQVA